MITENKKSFWLQNWLDKFWRLCINMFENTWKERFHTILLSHVKKFISIGLIFVLSAQCLYKLGILAYFQINRSYIAEVLCINKEKPMTLCYGDCFLKKNLKFADETEKSTPPSANKENLEIPFFILSEACSLTNPTGISITFPYLKRDALALNGFPTSIFHPPSAANFCSI